MGQCERGRGGEGIYRGQRLPQTRVGDRLRQHREPRRLRRGVHEALAAHLHGDRGGADRPL